MGRLQNAGRSKRCWRWCGRLKPAISLSLANTIHQQNEGFHGLVEFDYRDVRRIMRGLEVEDYCEGPLSDDKGRPHDLWVFGAYVAQFETYIKFAIYVIQGTVKSICVSFHEAERPLSYPYRKAS